MPVEQSIRRHVALGFEKRGHAVTVEANSTLFGKEEVILRGKEPVWIGASEPRRNGKEIVL